MLPDQRHAIRDGVGLILLVIRDHMVDAWIGGVAVPNYISTCVEIDSSAPSPKGGIEFRMDVGRMSYRKVEDEVASGIRGQRSVGYKQGLDIIGSWCHEWGSNWREYWCKRDGRDVWVMYDPVVPVQ